MNTSTQIFHPSFKIIVLVTLSICIISSIIYIIYQRKNSVTVPTKTDLQKKFGDEIISLSTNELYLYSKLTNTLYKKNTKGTFYIVKDGANCSILMNKSIPITDVQKTFSCKNVPDKYKSQCNGSTDPNNFIVVTIQSASDFEKVITDTNPIVVTPETYECNSVDESSLLTQWFTNKWTSVEDFFSVKNGDIILQVVGQFGVIVGISMLSAHLAIIYMILPMIFSGNSVDREKGAIIGGSYFIPLLLKTFAEKMGELSVTKYAEEVLKLTDGEIMESSFVTGLAAFRECIVSLKESISDALTYLDEIPGVNLVSVALQLLMFAGMFLDSFDACGLNSDRFSQDILLNYKKSLDRTIGLVVNNYNDFFNASNVCDYKLMTSSQYWALCLPDDDPGKKMKQTEYGNDDLIKMQQYSQEYLTLLKVNSQGEMIKPFITNDELYTLLTQNFSQIDWSDIKNGMKTTDLKDLYSSSMFQAQFDIIFADNNVIVANYVAHYKYIIAIFFFIVLCIVFYM
jgi:hypothetical protein